MPSTLRKAHVTHNIVCGVLTDQPVLGGPTEDAKETRIDFGQRKIVKKHVLVNKRI